MARIFHRTPYPLFIKLMCKKFLVFLGNWKRIHPSQSVLYRWILILEPSISAKMRRLYDMFLRHFTGWQRQFRTTRLLGKYTEILQFFFYDPDN